MLMFQFDQMSKKFIVIRVCQWLELFMPPGQWTIFKFRDLAGSKETCARVRLFWWMLHNFSIVVCMVTTARLFLSAFTHLSASHTRKTYTTDSSSPARPS